MQQAEAALNGAARSPRNDNPLAATRALVPWLAEQAARTETEGRIPEDVAGRLIDAGVFDLTVPRRYGGLELSPAEAWPVVFEVARGCASSAWLVGLIAANILMLGKFSDQAQAEVFDPQAAPVVPMLTGGVGKDIEACATRGGIVLSGQWRYASGVDIASWVGLLVTLPETADRKAAPAIVLVPASEFAIDHDSWNVLGMRGTGSKTVTLSRVFVPQHRFLDWATLQAGGCHPDCSTEGAIYRLPLNAIFAMSVAAPTLGVASAVVESFRDVVATRVSAGTGQAQVDDRLSHIRLASADATISMLRDTLVTDSRRLMDSLGTGAMLGIEARAAIRTRIARSAELARSETQGLFGAIGGAILPTGSRIERLFRDLHAMSSHFLLQTDVIGELHGRLMLGLDIPAGARV
ncbi:MAG: acyl-CoA dehydrogenase family protein [Pararhodobacter sp.]|nr:acyl-CoA dehydrogenase family protein [Pararhodobacter sp.]